LPIVSEVVLRVNEIVYLIGRDGQRFPISSKQQVPSIAGLYCPSDATQMAARATAMIDWPIAASDSFMVVATTLLVAAPVVGLCDGWRRAPRPVPIAFGAVTLASFAFLAFSWRGIPGGIAAAALGHVALGISTAALAELGRMARICFSDRLAAAMASLAVGALLVTGVFAMAPLTENVSSSASRWLLTANPLVTVTSAAGIDLLHLDTIYRTSPLAHRGLALPAWPTACLIYAVVGLAVHGVSRIHPWSRHA
jgi:hypothetical protein